MATAPTEIDLLVDKLIVEPMGWNKLWSLRSKIEIPFSDIVSIEQDRRLAENGPVGLRLPGANLPGIYLAGTFWKFWGDNKVRSFWVRRHAGKCITIRLRNHHFNYVTVEVHNPETEIRNLQTALRERGFTLTTPGDS